MNESPADVIEDDENIIHLPDTNEDEILEIADKRLQSIKRVKEFALTLTNPNDWVDIDGKPYLVAAGAEKIARPFGVKIKMTGHDKEAGRDEHGEYYIYTFYGTATLANDRLDSIDVMGICSSRDKFFGTRDGEIIPMSEISEPNIKRKAYNNMVMNGITRLLGLRNMTWEEVESKIDRGKVAGYKYGSRKADTSQKANKEKGDIVDKISRLINEYFGTDPEKQKEILLELTDYKNLPKASKLEHLKKFTNSRCQVIYGRLKDKLKNHDLNEKPEKKVDANIGDENAEPPPKNKDQTGLPLDG